ncbi:MAG: hypothetical protein AAGD96_30905, partial [Chloroflexota bacterium]
LAADDGSAGIEHHLKTNYPTTGKDRSWSKKELHDIATNIDHKVAQRTKKQRSSNLFRQIAWATAAFVILIGISAIWIQNTSPTIEPAAEFAPTPTKTLQPPPTLQSNFQYANLSAAPVITPDRLEVNDYPLTIGETKAQWSYDLSLPVQMPESWIYLGSAVHTAENGQDIFEIAFIQITGSREELWILSQAPAENWLENEPLPVIYQPIERIDAINSYEDKEVEINQFSGRGFQYELVDQTGPLDWIVYNTVTWQQGDQVLTLTFPAKNNFPTTTIASMAEKLDLQLQPDDSID